MSKMHRLLKYLEPKSNPFSEQLDDLLSVEIEGGPPRPIVLVSKEYCALDNMGATIRNFYLLPWAIALIVLSYAVIVDHIDEWKETETRAREYVANKKEKYGEDYFEHTNNTIDLRLYKRLDNGSMPYVKYLKTRYYRSTGFSYWFKLDMGFLVVFGIFMPVSVLWVIRWPLLAPLYFNRERQLIYTWRKGKVWAARYSDVRVHENFQGFYFHLHYFDKRGALGKRVFAVQSSHNPTFNTNSQPVLAFVSQFMEYGKEHVYSRKEDYIASRSFNFFEDKKPEDFDSQLAAILDKTNAAG